MSVSLRFKRWELDPLCSIIGERYLEAGEMGQQVQITEVIKSESVSLRSTVIHLLKGMAKLFHELRWQHAVVMDIHTQEYVE